MLRDVPDINTRPATAAAAAERATTATEMWGDNEEQRSGRGKEEEGIELMMKAVTRASLKP